MRLKKEFYPYIHYLCLTSRDLCFKSEFDSEGVSDDDLKAFKTALSNFYDCWRGYELDDMFEK